MLKKTLIAALFVAFMPAAPALAAEPSPGETVTFEATDGTPLSGVWRGDGGKTVILSHQAGITQEGWAPLVAGLQAAGYTTLTYNFRGHPPSSGTLNTDMLDADLRGAIAFARSRGADHLTLIGASMGGIATAMLADEVLPDAYVAIASSRSFGALRITDDDLAVPAAKLFITAERDGAAASMKRMAEAAADPATLSLYPGSFHALLLFKTPAADQLVEEIVGFVKTHMPL
jgi:Predicted hydrolase of the alpha/beta superfamily